MTRVLLLLPLLLAAARAEDRPERLAGEGAGTLWRAAGQRVLVVRGTPREMGLAHGRLLREEVRANVRAFLDEWALGERGRTREELRAIWEQLAPHVPRRYHEELTGLAEGSGVPLDDLRLVHALPSRYHCTGTAALPAVTRDGKVYHTRSLDYALDIGATVRPQTNALLLIAAGEGAIPHAIVTWAGFTGCVTGMSAARVSVGEMGSRSRDETFDGLPMVFLLREVLGRAKDVRDAKEILAAAPRTCGFNYIVCDPGEICAVECSRSAIRFFGPGDEKENVAPHYALDGIVRRCNHFVDPELAATQRAEYDPRRGDGSSFLAYEAQGRFLAGRRGRIDAEAMVELLRGYPATHPCLHQAVMCPNDLVLWVAQARDPRTDPLPGAQNQPFVRHDLAGYLAGEPAPVQVLGADRVPLQGVATGVVRSEKAIEGFFAHEPAPFDWRLEALRRLGPVTIHHLTYPSPGPSLHPENWTVHAEYYRPEGEGPFPAVVVLHILDGRFFVARLVANALAQRKVAALFIMLPYYGDRRPRGKADWKAIDVPDAVQAVRQGVRDIRRGAAWLRERPEVDASRVGITGTSLGSFLAQLAAGADGSFDRCAFVLGGGSIVDAIYSGSRDTEAIAALLEGRGWTRARLAEALAPVEPLALAAGIRKDGVLMINCRQDEVVPPASTERYWEALGRPEILWYDGGHYALKGHVFEVLDRLTGHFGGR